MKRELHKTFRGIIMLAMLLLGQNALVQAQNLAELQKILADDGELPVDDFGISPGFGGSVSVSGDYAIVGAHGKDGVLRRDAGAAYIFKRSSNGTWALVQKLVASDASIDGYFGFSVSMSGDYAIVGAIFQNEFEGTTVKEAGSAYIFERGSSDTWVEVQKLVASDRAPNDDFGYSVSISGNYAIVGAFAADYDTSGGNGRGQAGSAYIFERGSGGAWAQAQKLVASDRSSSDVFGNSVSISGDYVIVGARREDHDAAGANTLSDAGSAYIFERGSGGAWAQTQKLVALDRGPGDNFGGSVSISGDYIFVGAANEDHDASGGHELSNAGSAYTFKKGSGGVWVQTQKLAASDRASINYFGRSVSISGDYIFVGASYNATGKGAAYIFGPAVITPDVNGVLHVNQSASGGYRTGNSWVNAITELADALKEAKSNTAIKEIWVAKGTYKPLYRADNLDGSNPADRDNAFVLVKDVKVYGAFNATTPEANPRLRDTSVISLSGSMLSGDFNGDDQADFTGYSENAYRVIVSAGDVGAAELNGFTISGSNADNNNSSAMIMVNTEYIPAHSGGGMVNRASNPILTNLVFSGNYASYGGGVFNLSASPAFTGVTFNGNNAINGGGMYNANSSSPVFTNVVFKGNSASESGGGIYNDMNASPVFTNVIFKENSANNGGGIYNSMMASPVFTNVAIIGNTANYNGGGMYNSGSPLLTNVTISKNTAVNRGGGIYHEVMMPGSNTMIRNSIIWGNTASVNSNVYEGFMSAPVYSYSLVGGVSAGGNNIDTDPLFMDPDNGDYTLQSGSPARNAGSNSYFATAQTPDLSGITTDLAGNIRIYGSAIDMGAYESLSTLPVDLISYEGRKENNGILLSWHTASEVGNKYYRLERSASGNEFEWLATVAAKDGNSAIQQYYGYLDRQPFSGTNYYRLTQVDQDGRARILGVRKLDFRLSDSGMAIYPNPAGAVFYIKLPGAEGKRTVTITDAAGQVRYRAELGVSNGVMKVQPRQPLPAGLYLVKVDGFDTLKLLVK